MEKLSDKLYNWASILDPKTAHQAHETTKMPFVWPYVALMPDAHLGSGATVGSVIPTKGAIMPSAVGTDIGCGMMAVRLDLTADELKGRDLSKLREGIEQVIPLSAGNYNKEVYNYHTDRRIAELELLPGAENANRVSPNWYLQLGTLGSGNHFIEVSLDGRDRVWLFLHSGSRGVGYKLADRHIKAAIEVTQRRGDYMPPHRDLSYLYEGEPEFDAYMRDLRWAQRFAYLNRDEMMERVFSVVKDWMGYDYIMWKDVVNCHHNYTEQAQVNSQLVWLSRKGAIDARTGVMGLIPGSMGTASYVVKGKGNELALWSAPHGAGREHSRGSARRTFTMEQLEASMEGIEWSHSKAFLDEIPGAYKPIDRVMTDAADLVEIRHTLHQIVNVKGD